MIQTFTIIKNIALEECGTNNLSAGMVSREEGALSKAGVAAGGRLPTTNVISVENSHSEKKIDSRISKVTEYQERST